MKILEKWNRRKLENIKVIKFGKFIMVNKFCVIGCKINLKNGEKRPVFSQPKNVVSTKMLKLISRTPFDPRKNISVCQKHFIDTFLNTNDKRVTMMRKYNPVPTLKTDERCKPHCTSAVHGFIPQLRSVSDVNEA